jgi:hypothetical protein
MARTNQSGGQKAKRDWLALGVGITAILGVIGSFVFGIIQSQGQAENNRINAEAIKENRRIADEAKSLSQRTYDRAAGKVRAKFNIAFVRPIPEELPKDMVRIGPLGKTSVVLRSPDWISKIEPRLQIHYVGDEPIDAVKVEARITFLCYKEKNGNWQPVHQSEVQQFANEEPSVGKKINTQEFHNVPFGRAIVSLLMATPTQGREEQEHYAQVELRVFGRLVDGKAFDEAQEPAVRLLSYVWMPKDFKDSECKEFLKKYNPVVTRPTALPQMVPVVPAR